MYCTCQLSLVHIRGGHRGGGHTDKLLFLFFKLLLWKRNINKETKLNNLDKNLKILNKNCWGMYLISWVLFLFSEVLFLILDKVGYYKSRLPPPPDKILYLWEVFYLKKNKYSCFILSKVSTNIVCFNKI